jgi:O-antigen ligase
VLVERRDVGDQSSGAELAARSKCCRRAHAPSELIVFEKLEGRARQLFDIGSGHEAGDVVEHDLGRAAHPRRHRRPTRGRGLDERYRHAFVVGGEDDEIARRVDGGDVAAPTQEPDAPFQGTCTDTERIEQLTFSRDYELRGRVTARHFDRDIDEALGPLDLSEPPDISDHRSVGGETERRARGAPINSRGRGDTGRNDRVLLAPSDPRRQELVAYLGTDRDQSGRGTRHCTLDTRDELGLRRREVSGEQMSVVVVHGRRNAVRPRRDSSEHTRLGLVRVNDVRPEAADDLGDVPQRFGVVSKVWRATETGDAFDREIGGAQRHVITFVRADLAGQEPVVETRGVETFAQHGRLERRTADVEAVDDAQHAEPAQRHATCSDAALVRDVIDVTHRSRRNAAFVPPCDPRPAAIASPGAARLRPAFSLKGSLSPFEDGPHVTTLTSRDRPSRWSAAVRNVVIVLLAGPPAIAVGLVTHKIPHSVGSHLILAVPVFLVFAFVVARGPRACLVMLVITAVLGLNVHAIVGGQHGLRVIDMFWVALVGWTLAIRAREGPIPGRQVGQRQVGIWLTALLVSLYPVAVHSTPGLTNAFVAWARLAETISLVWLVPYALRKIEDVEYTLCAIEVAIASELVIAIAQSGGFGSRLSGANGPDTTGLLAALVLTASIHAPVPRHRALRTLLFVVGLVALLMTKSVGSLAAAGVMLGVFGLRSWTSPGRSPHRGLLTPARLLLLVLALLAIATTVRPGSLPGSANFSQSTTLNRTVIATAGLELFRDHPVVGVGWSRGPAEIGSTKIDRQLRALFGNSLRPDFLVNQNLSSLHNAYIEMLAEAGVLGFACFVALLVVGARGIRSVIRSAAGDRRVAACAWCAAVLLVGVLVWWNDNALFGAQPETVLAATLLGILAAIPRVPTRATTANSAVGSAVDSARGLSPR